MASSVFICVILMTFTAADVASGSTQGSFPLKDCTADDTDILSLLCYDRDQTWYNQDTLMNNFNYKVLQLNRSSQWMSASVLDPFNAHTLTINVSTWSFRPRNLQRKPYVNWDADNREISVDDVNTILELKIQFVERLFNEMSGVRKNAIHVGVVFLDGTSLTQEEIRNVSYIVQQRNSDVKIFVVIVDNKLVEEIVHLTDTIVLPNKELERFQHYLLMAMCKKCAQKGLIFEHKASISGLSCYSLDFTWDRGWNNAMSYCNRQYHGFLAGIETLEEMEFLEKQLYIMQKENYKLSTTHHLEIENEIRSTHIHIGLHRDLSNYAKRFKWMTNPGRYRPLLFHHWLPGKPTRGVTSTDCAVWVFQTDWTNNQTSDGWSDVECLSDHPSLILCEVVLPEMINVAAFISIKQVPAERFNSILEKGNFLKFQENIVSVSENVGNPEFLQLLRDSNYDFPIFDCGEDAGDRRYISYSMVCDFVDHCSNRRDEISCLNPREINKDNGWYCSSGQMLQSFQGKCDNVKDCIDGSDEANCFGQTCYSLRCCDGSCLPWQWLNDGEFDCFKWIGSCSLSESDESPHLDMNLKYTSSCSVECRNDTCIDYSIFYDDLDSCRKFERPLNGISGFFEPANTCTNNLGHFIWAPKCHYFNDRYGAIIGCRDMSHLRDCVDFQCSQEFVKCYKSYCIPQHYLLDGKEDCPTGEDEQLFYTGECMGYFACWDSKMCLHPDRVCDGHSDCPHYDDELDCHRFCPEGFRCIAGAVTLSDYNRSVSLMTSSIYYVDRRTRYLDLSGVDLSVMGSFKFLTIEIFFNLKVLILSNCNISQLYSPDLDGYYSKIPPYMIQKLDISYNVIREIFSKDHYTYYYKNINYLNVSYNTQLTLINNLRFSFLEVLDLSHTCLSFLNDAVFVTLPRLKHLNLSHTLISDFSRQYFPRKLTLQTLDLRGILTNDLHDYMFHGLAISQTLYTDHYQICCPQIQHLIITPQACIAPVDVDAISSCFNLLGLDVQHVLLWLVAVLAVLGNITVIVYRVIWDRSVLKTGYGLFVTNLGISDCLMGVYLLIIAGADYLYRDNYVLYDKKWRDSDVCKIAGFMACLSCEASTFFVFLITIDRFLTMKFPFGQKQCSRFMKIVAVTTSWVASFTLSLVPIVFSFDIYSSNAMCLGLPLRNTHVKGYEYSVGVFIIYNFIMFLFIACGQYTIFRAMSENRISKTATSMSRSRRAQEIVVAKQLSLVVLSNFLFWFPVGFIGLMSLGGHEVSNEVYAWTTVLLLPINSAVNPVLYTIPALMERWEKFKHGDQRTLSTSI